MNKQEASKKVAELVLESRQKMTEARELAIEHDIPFSSALWANVDGDYSEDDWYESDEDDWEDSSWQSSAGCEW